jgi:PAS domain S-box-containing protein
MNGDTLPYLLPYFVSLGITLSVAGYAWRRRHTTGARAFALAAFSEALWTLGYILELVTPGLAGKIFWDDVQFFAAAGWALGFFAFGLAYTGRRLRHIRLIWAVHIGMIAVYLLLLLTDRYHHLIRPTAELIPGWPFAALVYPFTLPTWIVYVYFMSGFIASLVLIASHLGHAQRLYRAQTLFIIMGTTIPLVGLTLTILDITLTFQRDTTPLTFALSNLLLAWGLFRYRLFALVPIARSAVIETLHDAVLILDDQSRIVDLNPAAQALTGRPPNAALGKPVAQIFEHWPHLAARLAASAPTESEITLNTGPEQRTFQLTVSPVRDQRGQLRGHAVIAHDITRLKQSEETLRESNQQLEDANKELEAFAYSISHDLRAPLRGIDGFARIVLEKYAPVLDATGQHYLHRVRAGIERMSHLINDLLAFSQLSRQPLRKQRVSPAEIARQALEELRPEYGPRALHVQLEPLPECQADPALLRQVFANLLSNALKYSRQREKPQIQVGCRQRDHETVYFVSDNGAGFDLRYADRLFGIFQRLHSDDAFEGTGVGLAIVQRIIHRHGGRIWAEAEVDQGATFYFTL